MTDHFQYDVFLSHASADKAAVRELAERLKGIAFFPHRPFDTATSGRYIRVFFIPSITSGGGFLWNSHQSFLRKVRRH